MLKRLGRSRLVQNAVGIFAVGYLRLVQRTTRFAWDPPDSGERLPSQLPAIIAMWHGQHFMVHYARLPGMRMSALISRSGDGELNANIISRLGVTPIRGSGGAAWKWRKRGGVAALREMLRQLGDGTSVALTADVPKTSRVAGLGIVTLAQLSGRPIFPVAVVCGHRIDFPSWDHASIGLPFGRGAIVLGSPIRVPADADAAGLEAARQLVQRGLDEAHARAYASVGGRDPGQRQQLAGRPA